MRDEAVIQRELAVVTEMMGKPCIMLILGDTLARALGDRFVPDHLYWYDTRLHEIRDLNTGEKH